MAWVIQVGSFTDKSNASVLVDKLQAKGYKAYTEDVTVKNSKSVRVFIGPMISKQAVLEEKSSIDREFGLQSNVLRFVP